MLQEFLSKVPLEHAHAEQVYLPTVQFLVGKVLDTNLTEEERELTLQQILTALGNCGTPINHFLTQMYISQCLDKEAEIPNEVQDVLKAMGVEKAIRTTFKDQLKGPEVIEQVAALLHSLFLKNAAAMQYNKLQIQGTSVSQPPFSRNVKFGFTQISEELAAAFLKLCCQEKDGQLLQQDGKYLLDSKKMNAMVEPFFADLGLSSQRELIVRECKEKINKLLGDHDLTSFIGLGNEDVSKLLDTNKQQQDLRFLLQDVPDDKIEEAYHEFLREKEFEALSLGLRYNGVLKPAAKVLKEMTMPLAIKRKRPMDTSSKSNITRKRSRRL